MPDSLHAPRWDNDLTYFFVFIRPTQRVVMFVIFLEFTFHPHCLLISKFKFSSVSLYCLHPQAQLFSLSKLCLGKDQSRFGIRYEMICVISSSDATYPQNCRKMTDEAAMSSNLVDDWATQRSLRVYKETIRHDSRKFPLTPTKPFSGIESTSTSSIKQHLYSKSYTSPKPLPPNN